METKKELLAKLLSEAIICYLEYTQFDFQNEIEKVAVTVLSEIQKTVKNHRLNDTEAMEEIVCIFEKYNLDFGCRHDY